MKKTKSKKVKRNSIAKGGADPLSDPAGVKLTAGQMVLKKIDGAEKMMCDYLVRREGELLSGMSDWRTVREWVAALEDNDLEWRKDARDPRNIYNQRNETIGLVRSGLRFVVSRALDDLFGTTPWMAALPEGSLDGELAAKITKHAPWKRTQAKTEPVLEGAVERIFNNGDTILRATYCREVRRHKSLRHVLVRKADGSAVVAPDGDYIFAEDEIVSALAVKDGGTWRVIEGERSEVGGQMSEEEMAAGADLEDADSEIGAPGGGAPGGGDVEQSRAGSATVEVHVVAKAPSVVLDKETLEFQEWLIDEEQVIFQGGKSVCVDFRAWRCPMNVAEISDAECRGHVYEMRLSELRAKAREIYGDEKTWPVSVAEALRNAKAETTQPKAEEKKTNISTSEGNEFNPVIRCFDAEFLWDPERNGDDAMWFGTVLLDLECVFFCDYLANQLPKRIRTFYTVPAINKRPNRWDGRGWWEVFEDVSSNTDNLWNSMLVRMDMASNPMTGVQEGAIEEDIEEVEFRPGMRVRLKNGKTMADFISAFALPTAEGNPWQTLEFMVNLFQLESGVSSAAQGSVGDLPQTNTATGIQSVLSSGSTLHKRPVKSARDGLQEHLLTVVSLDYMHQDRAETFQYGEGENAELATITPEEVADLPLNVRLLMTRFRQRELMENTRAAIIAHREYLALPEDEKGAARGLYMQLLNGLDITDADSVLRRERPPVDSAPVDSPEIMKSAISQFKTLPPAAKVGLLEKMGLPSEGVVDTQDTGKKDEKSEVRDLKSDNAANAGDGAGADVEVADPEIGAPGVGAPGVGSEVVA